MGYAYVALTILLTVYGQLAIKWQVNLAGAMPDDASGKVGFLIRLLLNPWIISALAAAFGAMLFWLMAMTKFDLSKAYPFVALNFPLVALLAVVLFKETFDVYKVAGTVIIIVGVIVLARSPV